MGENNKPKSRWKAILFVVVIISLLLLSRFLGLGEKLTQLRDWIKSTGFLGPAVFVLIYSIATVAAIPGSAMTVVAGSMFGSVLGVIIVSIASTLGASLAFLASRYFARDAVSRWLSSKEKFRRLDNLTEKHGAIIVAITRLVPLFPYTLLNYGFGLTKVHLRTYVFWSWLCMIPGTMMYVVGADTITKGIAQGRIPWALVGVFMAVIILITFLVRHARRVLREKETSG